MKYYMVVDGQQTGPFEEDEMLSGGLTASTLVWSEGWSQWTPAGDVAELSRLLAASGQSQPAAAPPQPAGGSAEEEIPPTPKTYLVEAILVTIFCCLPFGILAIVRAAKVLPAYRRGDYYEAEGHSDSAKHYVWIAFIIGLIFFIANVVEFISTGHWIRPLL